MVRQILRSVLLTLEMVTLTSQCESASNEIACTHDQREHTIDVGSFGCEVREDMSRYKIKKNPGRRYVYSELYPLR